MKMISAVTKFTLGISLIASVGITGCYFIYKKLKSRSLPKNWRKWASVKKLYIYPLKSGRYIDLKRVECTKFGFAVPTEIGNFQLRDRLFMVYGGDLTGKSARIYPKMVLISISTKGKEHIVFEAPGKDALCVRILLKTHDNIKTVRFQSFSDEYMSVIDLGDEAAKWFSQFLRESDSGLRLCYYDVSLSRSLDSFKDKESLKFYKYLSNAVFGLYSDLSAIHLLNEKSLDNLNEKLEKKVRCERFRPNIVIDGPDLAPFDEDDCLWMKIGDVVVRNVKECTRCVLTTIDPETGVLDTNREPLKTLSTYRISKGPMKSAIMGVNLEVVVPGTISVNDEVLVGYD